MKIALVYFAYSKDEKLLLQSLRSVDRVRVMNETDDIDVFVVDDALSPLPAVPSGVFYERSTFDRCGNLNGIACVCGMLEVFTRISSKGYDWVCKVDCDTYINDVTWFSSLNVDEHANAGMYNHLDFAHGCFYAMTRKGVEAINRLWKNPSIRARAEKRVCEDQIFSHLCEMSGLRCARFCNVKNKLGKRLTGYQDTEWIGRVPRLENPDKDLLMRHISVTFKQNMHFRTAEEAEADRADAIERMTEYADFVEASEL